MKRTVIAFCCLLLCLNAFGDTPGGDYSPISFFRPVYITSGVLANQVKMQISAKWELFQRVGLYMAYSQLMMWNLYDPSSPFKDINFNPEVFFRFESGYNFAGDAVIPFLDYIQLGFYEHNSNGLVAPDSRGYNRFYLQTQFGAGDWLHVSLNAKFFVLYDQLFKFPLFAIDNPDIQDYIGWTEFLFSIKLVDLEKHVDQDEIYVRFAPGGGMFGFDFTRGYQEIGLITRDLIGRFRIYLQLYHGYAEYLLQYKDAALADTFRIRAGIIIQ
jgi:phospholipase A1/A2